MIEKLEYKLKNREKVLRANKSKFWCKYCDSALVGEYGRCPNCGRYNYRKKRKTA